MSEARDRAMAIATLAEAFLPAGKRMTDVQVRVYDDGMKEIPTPLLNAAVRRAIASRTWFPKVAEIRADAEACRRELVAAHPYQPCEACNFTGWLEVPEGNIVRSRRCQCWMDHLTHLKNVGALKSFEEQPALPAAREVFDARMAQAEGRND